MSRQLSRLTLFFLIIAGAGASLLLLDARGLPFEACLSSAETPAPAPAEAPPAAGSPATSPAPSPSSPPTPTVEPSSLAAVALLNELKSPDNVYLRAAGALRQGDCRQALELLSDSARQEEPRAPFARVVRGLHAEACGDLAQARDLLFLGGGRGSVLEDWRLLTLARVTFALGEEPVARGSLDTLLERYLSSPLWPEALLEAARQARETEQLDRLYSLEERGRAQEAPRLPAAVATELGTLVWEAAGEAGDQARRRQVGRQLLIEAPEAAEGLDVPDLFREPDGRLDWGALLTPEELTRRARALTAERRYDDARDTLRAVAEEQRDFDWRVQMADLLVRDHRGGEALAVLDTATVDAAALDLALRNPQQAALLAWQRALAKQDLAAVRRGRTNRPAAERRTLQRESWDHLRQVVTLDADPDLTRAALRRLFTDLVDEGLHDAALETLERLRERDEDDATGAHWLWQEGWEAFQQRNHSGAIGWWAELADLYPDHRLARSGRYWTARAFEALAQWQRARDLYRQVADTDTTDFYRRYALARLQEAPLPGGKEPGQEPAPWPQDVRLARARLLTEVGLDAPALTELEAVLRAHRRQPADSEGAVVPNESKHLERAGHALESEILARQGQIRASIGPIRRAFPALGGPYQAAVPDRALRLYYPLAYEEAVRAQAQQHDVPLHVLYGMIRQESGFDPTARSRAGARGLLQLMPATGREVARRIGLRYSYRRLSDPSFNVAVGAAYFRQMLDMFDDQLELALAGYNGGPYRIKRLWHRAGQSDLPHFLEGLTVTESRIYVKRILVLSDSYRQLYDLEDAPRLARAEGGVQLSTAAR